MTYRQNDSSSKDTYSRPQARLNQQINSDPTDEGCPVIEESGTVCGETYSLGIFKEFRQIYDDCLKNLAGSKSGSATLKKLAPFRKLIDNLWEQNKMLVETVEELEQEAACRVSNLQDRLNKCCQKDVDEVLKAKEREVECLLNKMSEKDDLIKNYCCQVEELKRDLRNKCVKYQEILRQLKAVHSDGSKVSEDKDEQELCDSDDAEEILNAIVKNIDDQKKAVIYQLQSADSQIKALATEKKMYLKERSELGSQLQCLKSENEKLLKEIVGQKKTTHEKEDLLKTIDILKSEKNDLLAKVKALHENIQELGNNFKETRWALTSEVAEKHDQVQELKRCVGALEEQLRQADMQTHFKDDIIKELRKELKALRKSERRGLYDVVNELRERKNECASNCKILKTPDMNKCQSSVTRSDGCYSAERQGRNDENKGANENEKFISRIECLKKILKVRVEEIKAQEEFMRDLEEELTKTKMDLTVLQEKYDNQEHHSQSGTSLPLKSDFEEDYATLTSVALRIEEMLRNLSAKKRCGLLKCKALLQEELQKVISIKNELEKGRMKSRMDFQNDAKCKEILNESEPCVDPGVKSPLSSKSTGDCNLVHVDDVEKFKERAVTGVVALEQMREQIDILENLIKTYIDEFPCNCDKSVIDQCEEKLVESRSEFDNITYQLCKLLQTISRSGKCKVKNENSGSNDTLNKDEEQDNSLENLTIEEICKLKCECQTLKKQLNDQGNESEKLKRMSKELDEEIEEKRVLLYEYTKEIDTKVGEIYKMREIIRKLSRRLKEGQGIPGPQDESALSISPRSMANLPGLFSDLLEFRSTLEQTSSALVDGPKTLREENEKLREKLGCLEKCVCNKDETLRVLQDTVKLRESQIEELTFRMQSSENHTSKLTQDVEEKCRLIANLQEAVRKCKQFEVNAELVESLRFEYCELECKLEKYEKDILLKDQKLEKLHNEITELSSKNIILTEKIKIMNPKLKIMYKTCHLFEKMVNGLQDELNNRECEIEGLYEKIKSLESELESEFKKCEEKSAEDSKCIEELSLTVKSFQDELFHAQENYKMTIKDSEKRFQRELELRECELSNTIHRLRAEINELKRIKQEKNQNNSPKIIDLDKISGRTDSQEHIYETKIARLQETLDCVALEHEEEKKHILDMLCEEKKENMKNKDDLDSLKAENQQLACEIEARKRIISALQGEDLADLSELEELICSLKLQKAELKTKFCNLKAEMEKEAKLKRILECRAEDLNTMLQSKIQEINQLVENYKCALARIQATQASIKEVEKSLLRSHSSVGLRHDVKEADECGYVKSLLDAKTAENANLFCEIQALKVEIEKIQAENAAARANKDAAISRLHHEVERLENDLQDFQNKCQKLKEENKNLCKQLDCWTDKSCVLENEFRAKQEDLSAKLRTTICEKNELLKSLNEMQTQLEQMCLQRASKEKLRELTEWQMNVSSNISEDDPSDSQLKCKLERVICSLTKEVKTLNCELLAVKENFNVLNEEYQSLLEELKCCEKKKCNLEKLYVGLSNENRELAESKANCQRELSELRLQNSIYKDKITTKDSYRSLNEKTKLYEKIKELTQKLKMLESKVIPELEQEISEKMCCIENLKIELKEANLSSQRMRNEALKVIQHTRKYLAAQRFANDGLKSRLECSTKRGNMLGVENRELEDQLKAVTRMNEFLLCQLENNKNYAGETEPRSYSPLPWGCSTVERDTSSSEYLAESGFQSMQPSPTNMDYQDPQLRNCSHWGNLKKTKYWGSVECHRDGVR